MLRRKAQSDSLCWQKRMSELSYSGMGKYNTFKTSFEPHAAFISLKFNFREEGRLRAFQIGLFSRPPYLLARPPARPTACSPAVVRPMVTARAGTFTRTVMQI
jgi:hypothetical protein